MEWIVTVIVHFEIEKKKRKRNKTPVLTSYNFQESKQRLLYH